MPAIRKLAAWFTPERRQLIQMFLASAAPVLIGFGFATQAQSEQWLIIAGAGLQFIASLLNLINLRGALTIWTALRGAIYTFAAAAAPALTWLGFVNEEASATILTGLSIGLSSLSALLAIFVSKDQALADEVAGMKAVTDVNTGEVSVLTRAEYRQYLQSLIEDPTAHQG